MKKVFIDTNVWLRYFLQDDQKQFLQTVQFFNEIEASKYKPYTSTIVLMEIYFVLKSLYKKRNEQVIHVFDIIHSLRNITILEKTQWDVALELLKETNVKLSDCLIASQIPSDMTLISYDQDFKKFKNLKQQTP